MQEAIQLLATMQRTGAVQQGPPTLLAGGSGTAGGSQGGGSSRLSLATGVIRGPLLQAAADVIMAGVSQLSPEQAATALTSLAALGFSRATVSSPQHRRKPPPHLEAPPIALQGAAARAAKATWVPVHPIVPADDVYIRLCDRLVGGTSLDMVQMGPKGASAAAFPVAAGSARDRLPLPLPQALQVVEALVQVGLGDHIVMEAAANTLAEDLEGQVSE